jgi:hypothetical protein
MTGPNDLAQRDQRFEIADILVGGQHLIGETLIGLDRGHGDRQQEIGAPGDVPGADHLLAPGEARGEGLLHPQAALLQLHQHMDQDGRRQPRRVDHRDIRHDHPGGAQPPQTAQHRAFR